MQRAYDAVTSWVAGAEPWTRLPLLAISSMAVLFALFAGMLTPFAFFAGEPLQGIVVILASLIIISVAGPVLLTVAKTIAKSTD